MNKAKFSTGHWHHRVPDFKLVFCGSKSEKERIFNIEMRKMEKKQNRQKKTSTKPRSTI